MPTAHLDQETLDRLFRSGGAHPHLNACPACRKNVEDARFVRSALRSLPVPSRAPRHLRRAVRRTLSPDAPGWFAPVWKPALAVCLVLLTVLSISVWRSRNSAGIPDEIASSPEVQAFLNEDLSEALCCEYSTEDPGFEEGYGLTDPDLFD